MISDFALHPTLPAKDLARAREFYGTTLGLEVGESSDEGFMVTSGGTRFLVYPSQFAGTNQATAAAWRVDDVELTVKQLRERGVTFQEYDMPGFKTEDGIVTTPDGGKGAWFVDTEGNILGISDFTEV